MNIEKRVKRHIWSQDHKFLITQPIALRQLCEEEMSSSLSGVEISDHGIYYTGRIETAYQANLTLRTASRVWLCLPAFKAGAKEELFRKTNRIFWELLISPDILLKVDARVRRSRIEHEGETAATVLKAIRHRFVEQGLPAPRSADNVSSTAGSPLQRLHIAAENDRVELRIEMSGDHLHKRGYRQTVTEAPLRETLAAGVVLWGLAQWRKDHPGQEWPERIHDPFCGSGTIPIEAARLASGTAPGLARDFLFIKQPHFRSAAFKHLKRTLAEAATDPACRVSGSDRNSNVLEASKFNAAEAGVAIELESADAFSPETQKLLGPGTLVITNPPYGERLSEGNLGLYRQIVSLLHESATPGVVLVPVPLEESLDLPAALPRLRIDNGGIRVTAVYHR